MDDLLDEWLTCLPGEPPAPDLIPRIVSAVAQRRRTRRMWRRIGAATLISAVAGAMLVLLSWPQAVVSLLSILGAIETSDLAPVLNTFLAAPAETATSWLDSGLTWQAAQMESIGVAFVLGIALLAVAAFGGLAQMLNTRAPDGYSH